MTIDDIIQLTQNRIVSLHAARSSAYLNGDISQVNSIDLEIINTQTTLDKLLTLKSAK